jgi:hypothetical protein
MNHDYMFRVKLVIIKSIPGIANSKCKGKVHARTGYEGPEGE